MPGMPRKMVLPAHQARSRESLRKLLNAATEVLGQHGVEGATIPRIARRAGLTPGSVYRRFHDKEGLLETAILEILERQEEKMKTSLAPMTRSQAPLHVFAGQVIGGMVGAYRAHAGLLRGMRQFVQSRGNTAFGRRVSELETRHFQRAVDLFLSYDKEIRHPDPRTAVSLALMTVVGTLFQVVVWPTDTEKLKELVPLDDEGLKQELTRAFLAYLRAQD
jgi:AcrR family transcriptional regulator